MKEIKLASFPDSPVIPLEHEVGSIFSVTFTDADGRRQVLSGASWRHRVEDGEHVIRETSGASWPADASDIVIEYMPATADE